MMALSRNVRILLAVVSLAGGLHPLRVLAADAPPNVLFCMADDASSDFGAYGCRWVKTPHIDGLAQGGVVFQNFYTPTAKCAPARAATLTGRNPWQLEEGANHQSFFPANYLTFTEALVAAGVHVGAQGKTWGPGEAKTADGKPRSFGMTKYGSGDGKPGVGFRKFLSERKPGQPFFYWYGSSNPHRSYKLDSGLAAGKKPADIPHVPAYWPDNEAVRRDMLDYAIEVEAYDSQVGELLAALEESGEADNTLVIVTSDHGMPFPRVKGHNYDLSNRIPCVVRWPKGITKPGRQAGDLLSLIDVAPTVMELFGVDPAKAGLAPVTGVSFTDLLRDKPTHDRSQMILGRERNDVWARPGTPDGLGYPVRGIRVGNLFYLHNFAPDRWPCGDPDLGLKDTDGSPTKSLVEKLGQGDRYWEFSFGKRPQEELFDLASDPDCVKNLAEEASFREQKNQLRERLFAELKKQQDPRILGKGDVFDNYPTAKKRPAAEPKKTAAKKAE